MTTRTWQHRSSTPWPRLQTGTQGPLPLPCGSSCLACSAWTSAVWTTPHLLRFTLSHLLSPGSPGEGLGPLLPWHPMICLGDSTALCHTVYLHLSLVSLGGSCYESIPLRIPPPHMRPRHSEHWLSDWSSPLCRETQEKL